MTRPRTDGNQGDIVRALIAAGASVAITTGVKDGFPDLAVGYNNRTYLMEIKMPGAKLTPDELRFFNTWRGEYYIVRTVEQALRIIGR